jgi:single-stranded-DNA-specific exonuclease
MKFRWSIAPPNPLLASQIAKQHAISPLLGQCLVNRGVDSPESIARFLDPKLKSLTDPFLLPDMQKAVDRLLAAREKNEQLVVFGDYDVDGVTATALLLEFFQTLGWKVHYYLPHRRDEGYGLTADAAENCVARLNPSLLLAVDCGSTSVQTITTLRDRGVDVVVLDHHQLGSERPPAVALVNPQAATAAPGAQHPFQELCSAGLAFKLAHAVLKRARETNLPGAATLDLRPFLDLVALGTIADLVPLTGENRILVSSGLQRLGATRRPGLIALKNVARTPLCPGPYEVGYQLAPRLNAAGRLETAEDALRLLLAANAADALCLANALDSSNRERQRIEKAIADEAIRTIAASFDAASHFAIVEAHPEWHIGVVGIVASRVLHRFYRPTIILGGDGELLRGSGRSIEGFDLADALRHCDDLLLKHGGHSMAAGVTVDPAKVPEFRSRLNTLARSRLTPAQLLPNLRVDAEVGLEEISESSLNQLHALQPMGQGNPPIQFCSRNLRHARPLQRMGADKQHVKMWVTDGTRTHEAVWWGAGEESLPVGSFHLAFAPTFNDFNGFRGVQLKVLDWQPA